jgi:hypothetical protein
MKKSSSKNKDRKEVVAAYNARIDLLTRATLLRTGDPACCATVAEILEQIAMGADANTLLIHPKTRVRQKSATELHNKLIAILTLNQRLRETYADAAEAEVKSHIGAGSGETVRQAWRQFRKLAHKRIGEEIESGSDPKEWGHFIEVVRRLMADIKQK